MPAELIWELARREEELAGRVGRGGSQLKETVSLTQELEIGSVSVLQLKQAAIRLHV